MDFTIEAPETAGHTLIVRISGPLSEPQILMDGAQIKPEAGVYTLPAVDGAPPAVLQIKTPFLDFAPIVLINDRRVTIAPPLRVWDYAWCALPALLLIGAGGIANAVIGLALAYCCLYLLRAVPAQRRYVWTGLINLGALAVVGMYVAAILIRHAHHLQHLKTLP